LTCHQINQHCRVIFRIYLLRKRERIGTNKAAAEHRGREVKTAITEGRYIKKSPEARTTFKALAQWYLNLQEVKAKRSYKRDKELLAKLLPHLGDFLLKDMTPAMVEEYKQKWLADPSGRTPEKLTAHDLRDTAINNWRLAGHDFFRIMTVSGHKTMTVFKRYNTVSEEELKALVGEKI
jgi:hypothetical protein